MREKDRTIRKKYWGFFVCLLFSFLLLSEVSAVEISPVRQTLIIGPGESGTAKVQVLNDESVSKVYVPEVDAFTIDEKTGAAIFGAQEEAKDWIRAEPSRLELAPGGRGEFTYIVSVPQNAEPLSRYLGLFVKQEPESGQVAVGSRAGSLFFLHIAGPVFEELSEEEFKTDKKVGLSAPVVVETKLRNNGTIHLIPEGTVKLKNSEGEVLHEFGINPEQRKVLPGGVWQAYFDLTEKVLGVEMGKLNVEADVTFGQTKKNIKLNHTFWFIPLPVLGIALSAILIIIIIVGIGWVYKKKRAKL